MIEEDTAICPLCKKPVSYKWKTEGGFIPEPHNELIEIWVYHTECWAEVEAKTFRETK